MRTDLKLNYDHLDETSNCIEAHRKELVKVEGALKVGARAWIGGDC